MTFHLLNRVKKITLVGEFLEPRQLTLTHLCSQKSRQVDLGDHLAATVTLLLVSVLVVLDQVPDFDPALQVRGDHGRAGSQAVRASSVLDHVLCEGRHRLMLVLTLQTTPVVMNYLSKIFPFTQL